MPWLLIPGALRRLRKAKRLTPREAAQRTGLNEWTIHRHEAPELAPRQLHSGTVRIYETAYECAKEDFVWWGERDGGASGANNVPAPAPAAAPEIVTDHGTFKLLDAALLRKCAAAYGLHDGRRFAVTGRIVEYDELPEAAASALDVPLGEGAVFHFLRERDDGSPASITVHARVGDHTLTILECADSPRELTVIVRVFVKPPGNGLKGFRIFGTRRGRAPFALVVEAIVQPSRDADFTSDREKSGDFSRK